MSLDASSLVISLEEKENWRRSMEVTVPADVVRKEEARAAEKLASRARLKGFRKGKVPSRRGDDGLPVCEVDPRHHPRNRTKTTYRC